jgi:hypothetical protein
MGVLNACAGLVALEEGRYAHEQIIGRGLDSDVFVGNGIQLKCMQNVGALRMLRVCSTNAISRCGHLECHTERMCHAIAWQGISATF